MQRYAIFLLLAVLVVPCAWSQASTGMVSGVVRDFSGAVIPNVGVTLTNADTNVILATTTNDAGRYSYPGVVSGMYRLSVTASGMERYEGAFTVQVAQQVVIDPVMKFGQSTTSIQVMDITPLVTTENATVSSNLEHARMEQLPMNGRMLNTW